MELGSLDWTPVISSAGSVVVAGAGGALAALWRAYRAAERDRDALNVRVATVVLPVLEQTISTLREVAELTKGHESDVRGLHDTLGQLVAAVEEVLSIVSGVAYRLPGDRRRARTAGRGAEPGRGRADEAADDSDRGAGTEGGGAA